jgi:hypothetical protein
MKARSVLGGNLTIWFVLAAFVIAGVVASVVAFGKHGTPASGCQPRTVTPHSAVTDAYDHRVLSLSPVMYLPLGNATSGIARDLSGHSLDGTYLPRGDPPASTTLPNGDTAARFDGLGQYLQVPSVPQLSVPRTGCLTVEAWARPDTLQFPREQGSGYAYILGKGTAGKQEYALRMYSYSNSESPPRPNRVSAYAFNLAGGEGSGAYFQDPVRPGTWMMVTFVVDSRPSAAWPKGYIALYKNGDLRGRVSLGQFNVTPRASTAPFRVATRDLESYFEGAVGKVAIYDSVLSAADISATYNAMYGH